MIATFLIKGFLIKLVILDLILYTSVLLFYKLKE